MFGKLGNKKKKKVEAPIILYKEKENCCGCSACFAICPNRAIFMKADEEGFLYPEIDTSKCIQCQKCISVCTFKSSQKETGYLE